MRNNVLLFVLLKKGLRICLWTWFPYAQNLWHDILKTNIKKPWGWLVGTGQVALNILNHVNILSTQKIIKIFLLQHTQLPRPNQMCSAGGGQPAPHPPCSSPLWGCKAWSPALLCESCSSPGSHWRSPHSSPVGTKGDSRHQNPSRAVGTPRVY